MISQELPLVKIIKIVLDVIPDIELPKRVGRPLVYSPKVMVCCFLIMVVKRFSKRDLYTFLSGEDDSVAIAVRQSIPFPEGSIPDRRTFDRRLGNCSLSVQLLLLAGTIWLARKTGLGLTRLSLDNRMFQACGTIWHRKHQRQGVIPERLRNIDRLAGWGYSAYRKWVFGHGLDVFSTTGKLIIPVLAIARSLTIRGNTAAKQMISLLRTIPAKRGVVAADSEYEDQDLAQRVQQTGRSLHAASKHDPTSTPKSKTYQKRKVTVEPFYERFLLAFSAREKLPFKGKQAWGWLMTAVFLYQVAVIYQVIRNHPHPMQVTHLIHAL